MGRKTRKSISAQEAFYTGLGNIFSNASEEEKDYDVKIWREQPVNIVEFCSKFRNKPLFPVQEGLAEAIFGLNPFEISQQYLGANVFWGKGCIAANTVLRDEETSKEFTIKQLAEQKQSILIDSCFDNTALRCLVKTGVPFLKGVTELFEVTVESGNKCTVSLEHRFKNANDWVMLKDTDGAIITENGLEYITSIKSVGEQEYYDIHVPVTNCYFAHGILHHNSGKDITVSDMQCYIAYWLKCLVNPQYYLREVLGCSIADEDAIDFGNVSINERQAKNVFFKKFKAAVLHTIDPQTGKNWFQARGIDLDEGQDIQKVEINFGNSITAHSLNSETHTGEGLNLLFVTIDEFGAFDPVKAFKLIKALRRSAISRFKRFSKVLTISYKYNENDPMHILYNKEKHDPDIYSSKAATYEVNMLVSKADFAKEYVDDPSGAKRTFECGSVSDESGYITRKYMLDGLFSKQRQNPTVGDTMTVKCSHLRTLQFKPWFRGVSGVIYCVSADLAKGKVEEGGDAAGITMSHCEMMTPKIDPRIVKELTRMGIHFDPDEEVEDKKGVVFDLKIQITADKGGEIDLFEVREFIVRLRNELGFAINYVTYDGWSSLESVQELNKLGIRADQFSVDKDNTAYDFVFKELLYQQLVRGYSHQIARREASELIINEKGKIDHPEKSFARWEYEGNITDKGSKDVTDTMAASGFNVWKNTNLSTRISFGWGDQKNEKLSRRDAKLAAMAEDEDDYY